MPKHVNIRPGFKNTGISLQALLLGSYINIHLHIVIMNGEICYRKPFFFFFLFNLKPGCKHVYFCWSFWHFHVGFAFPALEDAAWFAVTTEELAATF